MKERYFLGKGSDKKQRGIIFNKNCVSINAFDATAQGLFEQI